MSAIKTFKVSAPIFDFAYVYILGRERVGALIDIFFSSSGATASYVYRDPRDRRACTKPSPRSRIAFSRCISTVSFFPLYLSSLSLHLVLALACSALYIYRRGGASIY